ncbi:MAG: EcsC family protein [Alphaproteobacteria bacterium]|nr:EcsC family protein [Alphaproteobacteria bacterium]
MSGAPGHLPLAPDHHAALARAVLLLEGSSFAVKVADLAGQPVTRVLGMLPKAANRQFVKVLEAAILKCLAVAIDSLDDAPPAPPSRWVPRIITGVTGGVGGLFGAAALPIELPLTTMMMLRAIAEIARHHGEDLAATETALACLEVFALGDRRSRKRADVGYYATRAMLAKLTGEVAAVVVQRGAVDAASPVVMRWVSEIATRFGLAVSERAAASALPIVGAVGGATVNVMFMNHFQRIAEGHFMIRGLERRYGDAPVRGQYEALRQRHVEDRS